MQRRVDNYNSFKDVIDSPCLNADTGRWASVSVVILLSCPAVRCSYYFLLSVFANVK